MSDRGGGRRALVYRSAKHFAPEDDFGQSVCCVVNLAPRKLAGVLSGAMILMAEDGEGELAFVSPPAGLGNGWTVR